MASWDRASAFRLAHGRLGAYYSELLIHYYRFLIPQGLRILELGCGHGDLLASVSPSFGLGLDFSAEMLTQARLRHPELSFIQGDAQDFELKSTFDVIILSDLVINLWDVQRVFKKIHDLSHPGTRIVINFPNNLWRIPMSVARRFNLTAEYLEQNWFAPNDIRNLLSLSGFDMIKQSFLILMPLRIRFLATLSNRFLACFPPFSWFALSTLVVARKEALPVHGNTSPLPSVSVIVPARNEAGNIESILKRMPSMGCRTEIIFVEGHSRDQTYETIENLIKHYPQKNTQLFRQNGKGKGDAVRLGFEQATGDILMILDADITVSPEDLPRFYEALVSRRGEFINGVRLVYPMENQAIRFLNMVGNKFFSLAFSWLLGQPVKDTLCGTKALYKNDYENIARNRSYFGNFDPFGDFDLLFGAAKLNLKIIDLPIRYRQRRYGKTNIKRWRHGWILLKMVLFAALRIKFI
ncbi:MAG: glycosyltransferase [Proteobacteria bacterium]|nr:glycosyltransferase [Pseudomonadota bacterium]